MKKITFSIICLSSFLLADTVELKAGWNLIGIPSTQSASILSTNVQIEKASGGGEGNTNAFTYKQSKNYSRGEFILGQAYWIKALNDTTLTYTKSPTPNKISLSAGWNLIYPFKAMPASDLANYPEIEKASGGGEGNTNAFTYKKSKNYARGETLPNQGYWIKATAPFDMIFQTFDFRAWGLGSETKTSFRLNGIDYTLLAYSTEDYTVDQSTGNADFSLFEGTILNKAIDPLQISGIYDNHEIRLKIFASNSVMDDTTFIFESDTFVASNVNDVNYGNLVFNNPNDYSVPQPSLIDGIDNPPASPVF